MLVKTRYLLILLKILIRVAWLFYKSILSTSISPHNANSQAVEVAKIGLFFNNGQVCSAGSRVFVHESIYDTFVG